MHGRNYKAWFSKEAGRDETYDYLYDAEELEGIKKRVEAVAATSRSMTVIANNHYRGAEVANALELKAMMTGEKVAVPEGLLKAYPRLAAIAKGEGLFD